MGSHISSVFSSLGMAKLLVLTLFCVALVATAPTPDFELEDEPRSVEVATPEEEPELDFDDEPRSMDVASPEEEGELDFDDEPRSDMKDETEELADNSEAL